ncbi:MAG: CocE/NonD family hydrolase [Dehalococcoidia bacterium]
MFTDPNCIRTANPAQWPQYPYDEPPPTPERSEPKYGIYEENDVRIPMRDGVRLAADILRPYAPGRYPAIVSTSPYTRQLQRSTVPLGQNEAGISEFWVPRGYAHVLVDVRGSNDSGGTYDCFGATERRDLHDIIEWVAEQPWCDGNIGMFGVSYYGRTQLFTAEEQPPHLKAIFPHDASCDLYRDGVFHGGIPSWGFIAGWWAAVRALNLSSGRVKDPSGMLRHIEIWHTQEYPLDGPYYHERSAWPRLDRIRVPAYFGVGWYHNNLHLRGSFQGFNETGDIPKRMMIGPRHKPAAPFAAYHLEALRWYDQWLKGMETRVMEGPPIQLWIQGENRWRSENEWPLARTQWRELFLGGPSGTPEGRLLEEAGRDGERSYHYDPAGREALLGQPKLAYRTEPMERDLEVTGPLALHLWAHSTATDTDFVATLCDEAPDGAVQELVRGWLRASHREVDPARSEPWRPYHPHTKAEPLVPKQPYELAIEIWPTANVFKAGHRLRLEIASCDEVARGFGYHRTLSLPATNTVLEGQSCPSRLLLPVIPR